ncbi:MAG: M14 family metallopeptidase [Bacillota bacterium]
MIETVVAVELPADESLKVKKIRIAPENPNHLANAKRMSIVTGIHGDELEGQYVCWKLSSILQQNKDKLRGIVDIYPALNPFGIDSITRGIPAFDLDMNRIFPGRADGDMVEYLASKIIEDVSGSDLCIDIHASNIFLTEVPQMRINELHKDMLIDFAKIANIDFIWLHGASTVLESTFAHSLNERKTPTLVVEMGVGMRITKEYGDQLLDGIFNLLGELGIYQNDEKIDVKTPIVSHGANDVCFLNSPISGMFIKSINHGTFVLEGQEIGIIVNPLTGDILATITAPNKGWLFTIREYPVVSEGSLMGRILKEEAYINQISKGATE